MNDQERIAAYDFKLGLGLVISDLFNNPDKSDIILSPLIEGEIANYDGIMKELQIICKNESLILTVSKNFIPHNRKEETYTSLDNYELVLVKELDFLGEDISAEESTQIKDTFIKIQNYLNLTIKGMFFFFYFPENIIIDYDGEAYSRVINKTELEEDEI